jgi:type II secretory pathway component PulF
MIVNLGWPRAAVYGSSHWYYQWGAIVFTAVIAAVGGLYYVAKQRGRVLGETIVEEAAVAEA